MKQDKTKAGTHTIQHHTKARHAWESKRSMEVFAMLREEVKHLRRVNADLLEAAKAAEGYITAPVDAAGLRLNLDNPVVVALRAAIRKAGGGPCR